MKRALFALLATGLVAALPTAASAAPTHGKTRHHKAQAAGGDLPPTLPSIVRVRITRGEASLARAADYVDRDMPDKAVASLLNARRNMYAAWTGAVYVIQHAPPPPAADAAVHRGKAHASGTAVGVGTIYADPVTTAVAVLNYQHDVAAAAFGLLDGAKGTLENSVSTTIFAALNRRDTAIAFIAAQPVPDPETLPDTAVTFDMLMPGLIPDLGDEMQQAEGLVSGGALTAAEKRLMNIADFQVFHTQQTINTYWPPVTAA